MRAELHELWHVTRPKVTQSVSEAAAQGDRSENAEYTYGKKMLREIDSRVRFLTKRLEALKVVSAHPSDLSKVYFGAWVTVEKAGPTGLPISDYLAIARSSDKRPAPSIRIAMLAAVSARAYS